MTILYVTQNGITDHIGRSQVAPYVIELAKRGFKIHVLSAEKKGQDILISEYQQLFNDAGVRWTYVKYLNKPPILGQFITQVTMKVMAGTIVRREKIKVIHCRSFPPALIAHSLKSSTRIKYIFDFRDFYADGGLLKSRGLAKLTFCRLKQLEGPLIRGADKIICLTEQAKLVLSEWYLGGVSNYESRFKVIPCCADFSHFDLTTVSSSDLQIAREKVGIVSDNFVLLYLGSLGPDYLLPQMLALFKNLLKVKSNAKFLFVSNNGKELIYEECKLQKISVKNILFVSSDRSQVPHYIGLADLSVVFIRADITKVGCSPTKLAELFACNVPVIANSGVGDMDSIIDLKINGSVVVKDFSDASLSKAIEQVLQAKGDPKCNIRENSRCFALEEGVDRYASVYRELLN